MYLLMLLMLQDDTSTEDDAMTSDSHQHVSFAVNVSHNDSISDSNCREGIAWFCQRLVILLLWLLLLHTETICERFAFIVLQMQVPMKRVQQIEIKN